MADAVTSGLPPQPPAPEAPATATVSHQTLARWLTVLAVAACAGPPLVVGFMGVGAPAIAAIAGVALLTLIAGLAARWIPGLPLDAARRRPVVAAAWLVVLAVASYQTARLSVFANDPSRTEYSAVPGDRFREEHCCLTAYAEAARFAAEGRPIYDARAYVPVGVRRRIGPLTVDPYHYPPPFLFLPSAVRLIAPDFFATRRIWFALQATTLIAAMLWVAWWIGQAPGRRVGLLTVVAWAMPSTSLALQVGNFQSSAIAMGLVGCLLVASGRLPGGAALVAGAAAAKIFPGILVLHVVAWARARVVLAVIAAGLVFAVASAVVYGTTAWRDFVFGELPRMLSGASFPQTENPWNAAVNQSFYGVTTKLRAAGVTWLDRDTGRLLSRVYLLALVAVALLTGRAVGRDGTPLDPNARLRLAALWLALLNGAAFLSPFVGVAYGTLGTVWLSTLMVATGASRREIVAAVVLLLLVVGPVVASPSPRPGVPPDATTLAVTLTGQLAVFAVNAWAVWAWFAGRRPGRVPYR